MCRGYGDVLRIGALYDSNRRDSDYDYFEEYLPLLPDPRLDLQQTTL